MGSPEIPPLVGKLHHYVNGTWESPPIPAVGRLVAVWGSGSSDIHAVGVDGAFVDYNGSEWRLARPTSSAEPRLLDIDGFGTAATAIGHDGSIWRLNRTP